MANATLGFERAATGHGGATFSPALPGSRGGDLDRPAAEFVGRSGPISGAAVGRRHLRMLSELAEARGRGGDPLVRQALAGVTMDYELARLRGWRVRSVPGSGTGFEGNVAKVLNSGAVARARDAANLLLGPDGQLWESPGTAGVFQEMTVFSPAPPIYAGSDQIQRNLLGERALGLPKEPGPAPGTPFRDLPKN
ncbi:MAG: acyl-CoA dehydrogenase family protein [Acidimicrobiia bacterium]|nr:acyl-CoA dehydrogenase family protein [Acidimicrobiia bacterium]